MTFELVLEDLIGIPWVEKGGRAFQERAWFYQLCRERGSQLTRVSPHLLCLARRARGGIHWLIMDLPHVLEGSFGNGVIHFTNEQTEVAEEGNLSEITIGKQLVK